MGVGVCAQYIYQCECLWRLNSEQRTGAESETEIWRGHHLMQTSSTDQTVDQQFGRRRTTLRRYRVHWEIRCGSRWDRISLPSEAASPRLKRSTVNKRGEGRNDLAPSASTLRGLRAGRDVSNGRVTTVARPGSVGERRAETELCTLQREQKIASRRKHDMVS